MNYCIIFSLECLMTSDNQPIVPACTIYNMITAQAQYIGHAVIAAQTGDRIPFVDIISDQKESERDRIVQWLDFNGLIRPRSLLLGNDPVSSEQIMCVFDDNVMRVDMWRRAGGLCFQPGLSKIVLPNRIGVTP